MWAFADKFTVSETQIADIIIGNKSALYKLVLEMEERNENDVCEDQET